VASPWRILPTYAAPSSSRQLTVEVSLVFNELECYGGPLDGQTIRLRAGQFEVMVPFSAPETGSVRRFAVYSVRRIRSQRRSSSGAIERPLYVLVFTGEEWRVA
jgi:hypothetical protein